jgi:hypothetical protein
MSDINVTKSNYFKVADLVQAAGKPWAVAQIAVEVESAEIGEYPADANGPAQDSFCIKFRGHEKPLGCNLTNRRTLAGIVGQDAEWSTAALAGTRLIVFAVSTEKGEGIRVRFDASGETPGQGDVAGE